MKLMIALFALSFSVTTYAANDHKAENHGKHVHSATCGHKAEKHTLADGTSHIDYEHDGHHHFQHGNHYDECKGPEADAHASL